MKLTWFGGTTIRIHIGGEIVVADPEGAPAGVDAGELVAGADRTFPLANPGAFSAVDATKWLPRRPRRPIEEPAGGVVVHAIGWGGVLVDAVAEPPLVLLSATVPMLGRWSGDSVVVLFDGATAAAPDLLAEWRPRALLLAATETQVEATFASVAAVAGATAILSMEPGLAVEI